MVHAAYVRREGHQGHPWGTAFKIRDEEPVKEAEGKQTRKREENKGRAASRRRREGRISAGGCRQSHTPLRTQTVTWREVLA